MKLSAISLYRPAWVDRAGRRCAGPDEDAVTMAVAALQPLVDEEAHIDRVVLVSRAPALLEGDSGAVLAQALRLHGVPVEEVLGGAPAVVDQLTGAAAGTAVVAVDLEDGAGAGAMLLGDAGAELEHAGARTSSLPLRSRRPGDAGPRTYDDPRLLRELVTKPALQALVGPAPTVAVGVPAALHRTSGYDAELSGRVELGGAAAVAEALALLADQGGGRVVALEQAAAAAVDLSGTPRVVRSERPGLPVPASVRDGEPDIPISLAAYARAFDAKVGLLAGRCEQCGTLSAPPRYRCLGCGAEGRPPLAPLPRSGSVYSVVTVRAPVPGLASPYSLAIVDLDGVELRLLAQVTDVPAGSAVIDDRGSLVLRKVAERQGIPDYGYAFQPEKIPTVEVAS